MTRRFMNSSVIVFFLITLSAGIINAQDLPSAIRLTRAERFSDASAVLKSLIQKNPNDGDVYFYYGENFLQKYFSDTLNYSFNEMADSASYFYQKGISNDPANPLNYVGMGGIALIRKNQPKAQEYFTKTMTLLPSKANKGLVMVPEKHATALIKMAAAYIRAGVYDTAQVFSLLRNAEKLNSKDYDLYIVRGDAYIFMLNDGSKAISNYNTAEQLNPKSSFAKLRVGQLWMRARNYPDALTTYREVVKIDSTFAPAYRELGYLYSRANRNDEAQANYKKFLMLSGGNVTARKQYVNTLFELKKYPEAVKELEDIIKVDTQDNDVNRALAYCYYETGQYDKGLVYSRKFFAREKPATVRATDYMYLGRLLVKNKLDSLAYEKLFRAFQMDTSKPELLSEAAMSLNRIKKYDKALEIYKMKIDLKKANPADYYNMGKVYYNLQEWGKVDTTLAYYCTLMPEHVAAYQWRARALVNEDPDTKLGLAKPVWEAMVSKAVLDSVKYSKELVEAYGYLSYYYLLQFNATKEQENGKKSLEFAQKILALDPTNDKGKELVKQIEPRIRK
jgi:tetratricopeptide (TPR) repeat protein